MSATDFGDPDQIIHIPARDLTSTREAKRYLSAAGERPSHRSQLWSWVAGRLRDVRGSVAHRSADTKSDRS